MEETPELVEQNGSTVAVSITRRVRQGREPEFEAWLQGITTAASRYPGFLGVQVIRPVAGSREYRAVVRFDSERNFRHWDESEERQAWYTISEELTEDQPVRTNISGTGQERALAVALSPLDSFVRTSVSGIGLLLLGTGLALMMANSPLAEFYERLWQTEITVGVADFRIAESLRHWVNDGLMALFFFIVGL